MGAYREKAVTEPAQRADRSAVRAEVMRRRRARVRAVRRVGEEEREEGEGDGLRVELFVVEERGRRRGELSADSSSLGGWRGMLILIVGLNVTVGGIGCRTRSR